MAIFFSGQEILQVAVNIEENGQAFYEALALNTERPELKSAYDYLAGQEKIHKRVFEKMSESAGKAWALEDYPGERAAYVKALADSVVFKPGMARELASKLTDDQKALDTALGFEKDSIVFYTEVRDIVREQDRQSVDWVIVQEKAHVKRILDLKNALHSPQLQEYGH